MMDINVHGHMMCKCWRREEKVRSKEMHCAVVCCAFAGAGAITDLRNLASISLCMLRGAMGICRGGDRGLRVVMALLMMTLLLVVAYFKIGAE